MLNQLPIVDSIIEEVKVHECFNGYGQTIEHNIEIIEDPLRRRFLIECNCCKISWIITLKEIFQSAVQGSLYTTCLTVAENRKKLADELSTKNEKLWTREDLLLILLTGETR